MCLIQVAQPDGRAALIDPLAAKDLSPLAPVMADPRVEKIFHAADNDIALLKRDFGFTFASLYDTQVAARFAGRTELGLQAILEVEFAIRLSKKWQRCDWSRRPLNPEQEDYAAEDVRHLVRLRDRLLPTLRAQGRESWAREESDALARLEAAPRRDAADPLKGKGAHDLDGRSLAILRELFALREEWAIRADLPLFKIVGDETLVELAVKRPRGEGDLMRTRGLSDRFRGRRASDLLAAIRRGETVPEDQFPVRKHGPRKRMTFQASRRIDRLKAWRLASAEKARLEPGSLLPQHLIERIAIEAPETLETLAAVPEIRRWRVEAFGEELLKAVAGPATS